MVADYCESRAKYCQSPTLSVAPPPVEHDPRRRFYTCASFTYLPCYLLLPSFPSPCHFCLIYRDFDDDNLPRLQDVWLTLTDYNRLAEYVPNLTQSQVKPTDDGTIRLWQEGAQKIVGFDFRASVEMFMDEHFGECFWLRLACLS